MLTGDRIATALAFALALGLAPASAFEGPARPQADAVVPGSTPAPAAPSATGRTLQGDVPRPPGLIPRGVAPAAAIPNAGIPGATLPRPRAPVPVLAAPTTAPIDRPLPPPTAFAAPSVPITAFEAFKSGARALRDGQKQKGLVSLEYAAEQGIVAAQWKLGRIYAEGDGVEQSDLRAFEYFSRIADGHADDSPSGPQARYVANAFVSLGHYYRDGIADSDIKADAGRARHMYAYAASYFADPDAQYHLGRLLL